MKNPHIIVGEPRRCVCGVYDGRAVSCQDVIAALDDLVQHASIRGSGVSLYASSIIVLESTLRPLIQDCSQGPDSEAEKEGSNA